MDEIMKKNKVCCKLDDMGFPVTLSQQGKDRFTVEYGAQVKNNLNYNDAATELGACIVHALACDGKLDNRQKGERP